MTKQVIWTEQVLETFIREANLNEIEEKIMRTRAEGWTQEQTEGVRKSRGIDCDPESFWAAMCMMYSDYHGVMQKFGVDRAEVYAELAKAFLCDKDSKQGREKLESYFECVSK